jgi:outer membrane protein assembly factor BamB
MLVLLTVVAGILAAAGCGGTDEQPEGAATGATPSNGAESAAGGSAVNDPFFGRDPARTHYLPSAQDDIDPPLRKAWSVGTNTQVDFPPIVAGGLAYFVDKRGETQVVRLRDRKTLWERNMNPRLSGRMADATAPTYSDGRILFTFIDGEMALVDAASGKQEWNFDLNIAMESPALVVGNAVYVATEETNLVALNATSAVLLWVAGELGPIESAPSYHDGRLFVTDGKGSIYCMNAKAYKQLWKARTSEGASSRGAFPASPAIAFDHVYALRDDGTVFAVEEKTGTVAWSVPTGTPLRGSAAVAKVPGTPPSVYVTSPDGHLYVLDALSGKELWRYDYGEPVSGIPVVIGHTVYTSSLKTGETFGIDVRTRRQTFELPDSGTSPVVSDGRQVYAFGDSELIGLEPAAR